MTEFDAIILTGGRGSRLGGTDKAALRLNESTFLDHALAAVAKAQAVVLVGPPPGRPGVRDLLVTREQPPFSGPAAGIAAGAVALAAGREPAPFTVLLACDMPHAAAAVPTLIAAAVASGSQGRDGASAADDSGRAQPLLSCIASAPLRAAIEAAGPLADAPVRQIVARLRLDSVAVPHGSADDVDTPADARRVGATIPTGVTIPTGATTSTERKSIMPQETEFTLDDWANELCVALELPASAAGHVEQILDVTRDAAHAIARPAAPIAAFLVGMAAGRNGASDEAIAQACATAIRLAEAHGATE